MSRRRKVPKLWQLAFCEALPGNPMENLPQGSGALMRPKVKIGPLVGQTAKNDRTESLRMHDLDRP